MSDHVHRRREDDPDLVSAPPGMTQEQLDFFTEASEHVATKAAKGAVRAYRNRALAAFVGLVIGLCFVVWLAGHDGNQSRTAIVNSGRVVSVSGCNRDFNTITALRGVLSSSDQFTKQAVKDGRITADDYAARHQFYESQLATLVLPDCRVAKQVVTDDPRDIRNIPEPLYPAKSSDDKNTKAGNGKTKATKKADQQKTDSSAEGGG